MPAFIYQTKINSPGINAQTVQSEILLPEVFQNQPYLLKQVVNVPMKVLLAVNQASREAMKLCQVDFPLSKEPSIARPLSAPRSKAR